MFESSPPDFPLITNLTKISNYGVGGSHPFTYRYHEQCYKLAYVLMT